MMLTAACTLVCIYRRNSYCSNQIVVCLSETKNLKLKQRADKKQSNIRTDKRTNLLKVKSVGTVGIRDELPHELLHVGLAAYRRVL